MKTDRALIAISTISLALSVAAVGLSGMNYTMARQAVTELEVQAVIDRQPKPVLESEEQFKARVESAIEAIVAARRADNQARQARAQGASGASLDSTGMLSTNEEGQVVYGNPDAEITIYTFADFRCSYCNRYMPIVEEYVHNSNGAVNWISKPFPVLGAASERLAQAGECVAREEGPEAYWRFSKLAYSTQNWTMALAGADLVDPENVNKCVSENRYGNVISKALADGHDLNITGTPASLVRNNSTEKGVIAPGYMEADQLNQLVAQVIK